MGLIPGLRRFPGGEHGKPLQYSCLENPMDRGAWQATVRRVARNQTWLKQLSMHAHVESDSQLGMIQLGVIWGSFVSKSPWGAFSTNHNLFWGSYSLSPVLAFALEIYWMTWWEYIMYVNVVETEKYWQLLERKCYAHLDHTALQIVLMYLCSLSSLFKKNWGREKKKTKGNYSPR